MVSAEVFYSPIIDVENDGNKSSDEDRNIEVLPQYSGNKNMRGNGMTVYERRQSEQVTKFGNNKRSLEDRSFEVSQIEHVKRDDILDDSLLLALQVDEPGGILPHLNDEESDANVEIKDEAFFA